MNFPGANFPNAFELANYTGNDNCSALYSSVCTDVTFQNLQLTVVYSDNTSEVLSLACVNAPCGPSEIPPTATTATWNEDFFFLPTRADIIGATLTGTLSPTSLTLSDSSVFSSNGMLTAVFDPAAGFAEIDTDSSSTAQVPEPSPIRLFIAGGLGLMFVRRRFVRTKLTLFS
jgi:hypothetical protein